MGLVKKNKLHNPQIVSDAPPVSITSNDIGRLWVDKITNTMSIAIGSKIDGSPELRNILDSNDLNDIDNNFYKGISEEFADITLQVSGDKHFDNGYDFFDDSIFLENSNQDLDDYYSFFYKEVADSTSIGYIRSISTIDGVKHIRAANGNDSYLYDDNTISHVKYSKIILTTKVKDIISITFDNKDILESGFELQSDKQTILIYADPEGFFINKRVKVKYII